MTQIKTGPPTTNRHSKQRLYRRLMIGFILGGVAIGLVFREGLGYPLLGEAIYWIGIVGFLGVWFGTSMTLFDERDQALERRASQLTLTVCAVVLVIGASAARVLPKISAYTVPDAVWPALYAYALLFAVFGVVYGWLRTRS